MRGTRLSEGEFIIFHTVYMPTYSNIFSELFQMPLREELSDGFEEPSILQMVSTEEMLQ